DVENTHNYNDTSISRHSSYKPDNSSGKESYSSSNGPRGNSGSGPYGNNPNRPQVDHVNNPYGDNADGRRVSCNPYSSNNTLPNGGNSVNNTGKAELLDDTGPMNQQKIGPYGRSSIITTTVMFSGETASTNADPIARRDLYSTSHTEGVNETPSRPSYSSSYLQQYVDTTLSPQPGADARMSSSFGKQEIDSSPVNSSLVLRQPRRQSKSQGGIQGEDSQGRWVGGATVSDPPIAQFDPEVQKFNNANNNYNNRNPDGDSYFTSNSIPGLGPSHDASPLAGSPTSRKRNSTDSRGSSRPACNEALPSEEDRKPPFVKPASSLTSKESEGRWISREDVGNKQELPDSEESLDLLRLQRPSIVDENANATNDTTVAAVRAVALAPDERSSNSLPIHHSQSQEPDNLRPLKSERNESADNMPKPPSHVLNNGYFGPRPDDQLGGNPRFFNTNSDHPLAQPSAPNPGAPYSVNRYPTSMSEPWQGAQHQNQAPGILAAYGSFPGNDRRNDQQPPEPMSHDKVPGLASRPSDASDLSLKQQQEFLRLTRLHSNPSATIYNSGGSLEKAGGAAHNDPRD
ncbi:hypothetical protein BGX20_005902, partial [Mortierella sp. AD010]